LNAQYRGNRLRIGYVIDAAFVNFEYCGGRHAVERSVFGEP